jgi:hypothetical protein
MSTPPPRAIHPVAQAHLTHANGSPVHDNLNIQTAGARGPALLQDLWLLEKLAHFDREVIPERSWAISYVIVTPVILLIGPRLQAFVDRLNI